jgi:hypothetical protein
MLALNEPFFVGSKVPARSSFGPLMYLIKHGQRDHALALVLDDSQITVGDADHLSDC